jgi:hypothetical protein
VVLALFLLAALPAIAQAQTFTVSNLEDSGAGSLREAVKAANTTPGADTIAFAAGLGGTISLSGTGLTIREAVTIDGPGAGVLTVEQTTAGRRDFLIELTSSGEAVTIADLHLDGGSTPASGGTPEGGDVLNENARLTVSGALITGGRATRFEGGFHYGEGGGIASVGPSFNLLSSTVSGDYSDFGGGVSVGGSEYRIADSTIAGNSVDDYAGGLDATGNGTIEGTTISGNDGIGQGGGANVEALDGQAVTIRNTTVAGNTSSLGVGGGLELQVYESGTLVVEGSTIAANSAARGGGIGTINVNEALPIALVDSIVAGNSASIEGPAFRGPGRASFSLVDDLNAATLTETVPGSDLFGVAPQLGPLADNGGPTETMALAPTSPAVNKGGVGLATDQRGDPRPVVYPGVPLATAPGANGSDLGAYELQAPAPPPTPAPAPPIPGKGSRSAPKVRLHCPTATRGGCRFAVQAVSGKPRHLRGKGGHPRLVPPKPESAITRLALAGGRSSVVTLAPKPKFAAKLDAARRILLRVKETVGGASKTTYRRLPVVG